MSTRRDPPVCRERQQRRPPTSRMFEVSDVEPHKHAPHEQNGQPTDVTTSRACLKPFTCQSGASSPPPKATTAAAPATARQR